MRFALVAVMLAGCGVGPTPAAERFQGSWTGEYSVDTQCDGEGPVHDKGRRSWLIFADGDQVLVDTGGTCGAFVGDVKGDIAQLHEKDCGTDDFAGSTFAIKLASGSIQLSGTTQLWVRNAMKIDRLSGPAPDCASNYTATLTKD